MPRALPLEYPVRNLGRRPSRTLLTGTACALVAGVLVATVTFVRSLEASFASQGRDDTAVLLSASAQRDLLRSAISPAVGGLVAADVPGVLRVNDVPAVSTEIHMGTNLRLGREPQEGEEELAAFVRGVTERAFLVHENVTLTEGRLPGPGEVIVGRLVADKVQAPASALRPGRHVRFEGGTWLITGTFAAPGTAIESEIWAPLQELKGLARRDDVSAVFVRLRAPEGVQDVDVFANRRLDLALKCIPSRLYYRELAAYFTPIRTLAWAMALLIAVTVVFTGANTLNTAVQDRLSELATLRALGFPVLALVRSLLLEAVLLAAAGGLAGLLLARLLLSGAAFRIGMGAFALRVDGAAVLAGFLGVLALAVIGTVPAALRIMRLSVAEGLLEE